MEETRGINVGLASLGGAALAVGSALYAKTIKQRAVEKFKAQREKEA
jgi:hypothetical protein